MKETALMSLEAYMISGVMVLGLKYSFARSRPRENGGHLNFDGGDFKFSRSQDSFPSGHTTSAFALASVLSSQYKSKIVSASVYTFAFLAASQRIIQSVHWTSDVLVGALIGTAVGKAVVKCHEKKDSSFSLLPVISSEKSFAGLIIHYKF